MRAVQTFDASGVFQDFCTKIAGSHVAMHKRNSGSVCARELFQCSKDSSSLVDRNEKKIFVGVLWIYMSDVICGGLLDHLGPIHLALDSNR